MAALMRGHCSANASHPFEGSLHHSLALSYLPVGRDFARR
jgi:hypothetical protein